jgi:putative copper export protein
MGLFPMACFLWHIHRGTRALPPDRQIETLHRFSQTSFMAVLILIATGSVNGWLMIGSWDKLVTTPSGKLFLAKMVVVIVMIGIAAFNRFYLMRRIHDVPPLWRILRRTILAESGLAVVVLLIVAMHT